MKLFGKLSKTKDKGEKKDLVITQPQREEGPPRVKDGLTDLMKAINELRVDDAMALLVCNPCHTYIHIHANIRQTDKHTDRQRERESVCVCLFSFEDPTCVVGCLKQDSGVNINVVFEPEGVWGSSHSETALHTLLKARSKYSSDKQVCFCCTCLVL